MKGGERRGREGVMVLKEELVPFSVIRTGYKKKKKKKEEIWLV